MMTATGLQRWWQIWVDLFGGLGLPVDKTAIGYLALVGVFMAIGYGFKKLVRK